MSARPGTHGSSLMGGLGVYCPGLCEPLSRWHLVLGFTQILSNYRH
jgi:hypothetical protein